MGGAAAAESLIAAPQGVAALVLVAPAIVALWLGPPEESAGDPIARGLAVVEELVGADDAPGAVGGWPAASSSSPASTPAGSSSSPQLSRSGSSSSSSGSSTSSSRGRQLSVLGRVQRTARAAAAVLKAVLLLAVRVVLTALSPALVLVLRRLIRSRR
jgi:pimeloyl-ACP methyl ester carboxylesterase